jgi:uncharacterized membrane protein
VAFCAKCGAELGAGATYCAKCGAPLEAMAAPSGGAPVAASSDTGLAENVAGLLCYVLWWLTGLIFILIDKRPFVRFHAAQSLVTFGAIVIAYIVLGMLSAASAFAGWLVALLSVLIWGVLGLGSFILWIVLMIKAYQGQKFKLPVVGDIAEKIASQAA